MNKMPSALPFKLRIVRERWYHRLLDRMRPPQLSPGKVVAQVQFDCTVQEGSDGHYHLRPRSPEILDRLAATLEALRVKKATTTTAAAQPEQVGDHTTPEPPDTLDEPKDNHDAEEQDKLKNNTPRPLAVHGYNKLTRDVLLVDLRGQLYQCALPKVRAWETPPASTTTPRKKPNANTPNEGNPP